MSEDPVRKYIETKAELDSLLEKVERLQKLIDNVSNALRDPFRFMVSNVNVGFPPEIAMGRVPTLNAQDWPSAQQIAEFLSSLHRVYKNARIAYFAIPERDRCNVVPLQPI